MSENLSAHFVAVVGGASAGSIVAEQLAERGSQVLVIEQNARPYGKIEDGLPRWHRKQRTQEYGKIDARLNRPGVHFLPNTRLGRDLSFETLAKEWGLSALILANGAWKDRPMSSPGAAEAEGRGLIYQNAFVYWFNHADEAAYDGPRHEVVDEADVVGGGLASIDVVKIIQLRLYCAALEARGIEADIYEMEHKGIPRYCQARDVNPESLGIKGPLLIYRRRIEDMPLASLPPGADQKKKDRLPLIRRKVLENAQRKFLFRMQPQTLCQNFELTDGRVSGVHLVDTAVEGRNAVPIEGTERVLPTTQVISSIGSIPEPIDGIEMKGTYYRFTDWDNGVYGPLPGVFAAGNVVTGQGNIKASIAHGRVVAEHVSTSWLGLLAETTRAVAAHLAAVDPLSPEELADLQERIRARQAAVGYDGDYPAWIEKVTPDDLV